MTDITLAVDQQRAPNTIGASEAAGILGLDKYNPPIRIWRRLRGMPVDDTLPDAVREAGEWGQALEPIVRGKYALATRCAVAVPRESFIGRTLQWMRCTPDGLVLDPEHDEGPGGRVVEWSPSMRAIGHVQVKTASQRSEWQWERGVPPRYEIQCRTELAVTGLPWCDVVCLIGGQRLVGPFRVHRDERIEANILRDLRAFWDLVQSGKEPTVDGSEQWRAFAAERMAGVTPKTPMTADAEVDDLLAQWRTARSERRAHAEHEESIKTSLLLRLGAAGATQIQSALGNVTAYKTGARTDWKRYALSLGGSSEPPAQFKAPSTSWALRAPSAWGDDD